jgi:hypothetical protein
MPPFVPLLLPQLIATSYPALTPFPTPGQISQTVLSLFLSQASHKTESTIADFLDQPRSDGLMDSTSGVVLASPCCIAELNGQALPIPTPHKPTTCTDERVQVYQRQRQHTDFSAAAASPILPTHLVLTTALVLHQPSAPDAASSPHCCTCTQPHST